MNLYPSTLGTIISDLTESLVRSGIRKVVLLNSHGGNELKSVLRELHGRTPAQLFLCNWYTVCRDVYSEIFERPDNHAGEMETSFLLAYRPELVAHNPDGSLAADEGRMAETRFDAVNRDWVTITRPWHLLTTNTGAGNPHAATAREGPPADGSDRRAIGAVSRRAFRGEGRRAVSVLGCNVCRRTDFPIRPETADGCGRIEKSVLLVTFSRRAETPGQALPSARALGGNELVDAAAGELEHGG